ncbi:SpoIIE family protein phosphatase [Mycobacterium sp.]|uniref:SpoIIE family protein phosphatase n=1 Tax=Mycobacterium sp. TaxID=1785 RepID=UPI0025F0B95E|nr:SpoIIE family protein phosphatase [Mycobacterium sp.]
MSLPARRRVLIDDDSSLPADLAAAVKLGGEMGEQFRDFNWKRHPLGAPQTWPMEVRSVVALTLTSRFPTVLWLGADDLFQVYNDAYSQILGDRHIDALGKRAAHIWWDIWPVISPMLARVLATGEATWSHDLMFAIVTGGRRVERYFTFTYSPLISDRGKTYGVFSSSYETTERVLSERRMRLLTAVASNVLDSNSIDDAAQAVVSVCDTQPSDVPFVAAYVDSGAGPTLRAASSSVATVLPTVLETLTDWEPARSRSDIHLIDNIADRITGLSDELGAACPEQALLMPLGDDHAGGALLVAINPRCDLDEQYVGFCQLIADQLTSGMSAAMSFDQQRRRADALSELDRAKSAFLTNVSHEFRTPLTLLLGPLDHALTIEGLDGELADQLAAARRNAGRLQRLVDSLLDFSRIEAGRATAALLCTDVGALTAHIAASFSELCQRAGLSLELDYRPALADVDPGMWETIVLNLLSNAVKYTLTGSVKVTVRSDVAQCHIAIRDTGVGISDADLKRLGERFFRADSAHARSVEGTGIGLSLVRGLVELQGGTIEYASQVARGTTVTVRLPRSLSSTPVEHSPARLLDNPYVIEAGQWITGQHSDPAGADLPPARAELVVVAEDNADMRAHLHRVLSQQFRTVLVPDGRQCLEAARKLRPDIIVTDVMMPRMDGFALVAAIREDPLLSATPVLMLSARTSTEAISEGLSGGADDYLPKPFHAQELIDRITARLAAAARSARPPADAEMLRALDIAQLEVAVQNASTTADLAHALYGCSFNTGDIPLICVGELDDDTHTLRLEFGGPVPAEARDRYHVASMNTPIVPVDVVRTGQPMIIPDTLKLSPRYEHVVSENAATVRATISQPLRGADGDVIGSLGMLWTHPREFTPAEINWAATIAAITATALDRLHQVQREHRIAVDFQDHLLDLDRSSTAAVVAAVYQPSAEALHVGGDWYLVAPSPDEGRIAISVGDVVGHGLPAAVAMSRLRTAASAIALTHSDPAAVLATLDRYALTVDNARFATVSYAVIETQPDGHARVSYSCAGHPWPLLLTHDQPPQFLTGGRRPPVGSWDTPLPQNTAVQLISPGATILLYTDGLIERAGESLDDGFARLQTAAASRAHLPAGQLCDELLEVMAPPGGYTDDVVALAIRPCHTTGHTLATVIPASLTHMFNARHLLRDWLSDTRADPRRETDILLATGEALSNAIEHGCAADTSKTVSIEAFHRDRAIMVTISDPGQWAGDSSASQRGQYRGRGLTMINGMADRVSTHRGAAGTRVTLTFDQAAHAANNTER